MGFSDDQIHDILELKEQLTEEIEKHIEEIEKLEKNISVLNTILKQTSFTKASDLTHGTEKKKDAVPIIKNSDGSTIANVFVCKTIPANADKINLFKISPRDSFK